MLPSGTPGEVDFLALAALRPHVLGIDDAPFEKGQREPVAIVGAMMEGADLVESVAVTSFPVDGAGATEFLGDWVAGLRSRASLQGVVLGGITIAGLGVVDIAALAERVAAPVLVATRRQPRDEQLSDALRTAGFSERVAIVEHSPRAIRLVDGLYLAYAGITREEAVRMARATLRKALLPEPLRVAHHVARAIVTGESRGRV